MERRRKYGRLNIAIETLGIYAADKDEESLSAPEGLYSLHKTLS